MGQEQIKLSIDPYLVTIELSTSRYSQDQKSLQIYADNMDADYRHVGNLQATYTYQELPDGIKDQFNSVKKLFQHLRKLTDQNTSCCMRNINTDKLVKLNIQAKQLSFSRNGTDYKLKLNRIESSKSDSILDQKLSKDQNQKQNSKISIQERLQQELKLRKIRQSQTSKDRKDQGKTPNLNNNTNIMSVNKNKTQISAKLSSQKNNQMQMTNDVISYETTQTINNNLPSKRQTYSNSNLKQGLLKYLFISKNELLLNLRQNNPELKELIKQSKQTRSSGINSNSNANSKDILGIDVGVDVDSITALDLSDNNLNNDNFNLIFNFNANSQYLKQQQNLNLKQKQKQKLNQEIDGRTKIQPAWKSLTKLWIDRNQVTLLKDYFISEICPKIELLSISQNPFGSVAISKIFCNRFKWPKLKMFKLSFLSEQTEACIKIIVNYVINLGQVLMPRLEKLIITPIHQNHIKNERIKDELQKLNKYGSIQKITYYKIGTNLANDQNLELNEQIISIIIQVSKLGAISQAANKLMQAKIEENRIQYPSMYEQD